MLHRVYEVRKETETLSPVIRLRGKRTRPSCRTVGRKTRTTTKDTGVCRSHKIQGIRKVLCVLSLVRKSVEGVRGVFSRFIVYISDQKRKGRVLFRSSTLKRGLVHRGTTTLCDTVLTCCLTG